MHDITEQNTFLVKLAVSANTTAKKNRFENVWIILVFAILALGILSPISSATDIPNLADYINHLAAVIQAKQALAQGQFPLRTMPLALNHLNYPLFQFYSPTSFTLIGLIYWLLTPGNPLLAMTMALWFGLVVAGVSMYGLAYWFIRSKPAALLAGVVYLYAPYYIIIVNHLASVQEILAMAILPGIFYLVLQQFYHPRNTKIFLLLSAGLYIFFTLHMPTAFYASLFFAIFLLTLVMNNKKHLPNLFSVVLAYGFAVWLAMWFLAPAAMFQHYMVISNTYTDANHLIQYRPTLSNLLFPAAARTSGFKSNALMSFHPTLGLPILAGVGICLYAFCQKISSGRRRADYLMPSLLLIFFLAFLLVWSPVNVWRVLPQPFLMAQYCWRLMGQVSWMGALLFAWAVNWLFKNKLDFKAVLLGILLIIISVNPWFATAENWQTSLEDFIKNPQFIYNNNAVTINYEKYPTLVSAIDSVQVDPGAVLHLNLPYHVPQALIKFAAAPAILLTGEFTKDTTLTMFVNGNPIDSKTLTANDASWEIPLSTVKNQAATQIEFKTPDNVDNNAIALKEFVLTGFTPANETINLQQITPYCKQDHTINTCELYIPTGVKTVELPQLYYPQLLKVTLNGKTVHYDSVLYQSQLLAAIAPAAGKTNKITIEFRGLEWANLISWSGWGIWLALLLNQLLWKRYFSKTATK
jgi:hypothetical protein